MHDEHREGTNESFTERSTYALFWGTARGRVEEREGAREMGEGEREVAIVLRPR